MARKMATAIVLAVLAVGCSKSKQSPPPLNTGGCPGGGATDTISCTWAGDMCDQVTGTLNDCFRTNLQAACTGGGGTYAQAPCNTTNTVAGYCYYSNAEVITGVPVPGATLNEYYYTASWTLLQAQSYCASPPAGVWQ